MKSAKNVTFSLVNLLSSMVSSFFLVPLLVGAMGVEAYGYVGIGQAFISMATVLSIAITSLATRYIVVSYHESKEQANEFFNSVLVACIVMVAIILITFACLVLFFEKVVSISPELLENARAMICFMAGSFCLSILACPFLSGQFYAEDLRCYYTFSALSQIARIVVPSVLFGLVSPSLWLPYAASFTVDFIGFSCYVIVLRKFLPGVNVNLKVASAATIRKLISGGAWASVNKAGAITLSTVSRYMVNVLLGAIRAGYYTAFSQFQTLFASFTTSVVGALVPNMIGAYAGKDVEKFNKLIVQYTKYVAIALGALCGIALVYLNPFFNLWVGEDVLLYIQAALLMISFLPLVYPVEVLNQVIVIQVRIKIPALVTLALGVINIVLMIVLCNVFEFGLIGIAVAQFIVLFIRSWLFLPAYVARGFNEFTKKIYASMVFGPLTLALSLLLCLLCSLLLPVANSWLLLFLDCAVCLIIVALVSMALLGNDGRRMIISILRKLRMKEVKL